MEFKLYKKEDYATSNWSGGTTTQLAIYPDTAVYGERNFIWRLSSATCDLEESDFTDLPDYNRILAVLKGEVELEYDGEKRVKLGELEYDYFDGASKTKSFGKITDYNLMTRKGYEGRLEVVKLHSDNSEKTLRAALSRGFYVTEGYAAIGFARNNLIVKAGEQLVINDIPECGFSFVGEGYMLCTEVRKPDEAEKADLKGVSENDPENTNDGKVNEVYPFRGKSSFSAALMLSTTHFARERRALRKHVKYWLDEEMELSIEKIEKYYVPFLIYVLGLCILACIAMENFGTGALIGILVIWTALCIVLLSPLLYLKVMAKPAWKHIKSINHLSIEERMLADKKRMKNTQLEKVMKKYEGAGEKRF